MDGKVAIVTDSIACIPREDVKKYNIREVPIKVIFGNRVYEDRVDLTADDFYVMLKEAKNLPTTAAPSPEHFLSTFHELSHEVSNILCITLSSKLSSTFDAAKIAAEMARETFKGVTIEVLDSRTAAAAEGLVVLAAARAAAMGQKMDDVINTARNVMDGVHLFAIIDTLKYLAKGGRVPQVVAWAGSLLKIKPIITLRDGEAVPAIRARTYLGAIRQVMEMTRKRIVTGLPLHMAIMHAAEQQKAEDLKQQIASTFDCSEIMITEFTPVMGAHTGPGLIGVAFYCGE